MRKVGQGVLELLIRNGFGTFNHSDLNLWPSDPINQLGSSATQDGYVDQVWGSLVKVFSNYWLERKRLQTDGLPMDRPTNRHVQSNMPSFLQRGALQLRILVDWFERLSQQVLALNDYWMLLLPWKLTYLYTPDEELCNSGIEAFKSWIHSGLCFKPPGMRRRNKTLTTLLI